MIFNLTERGKEVRSSKHDSVYDEVSLGRVPLILLHGSLIEGAIHHNSAIAIPLHNGETWITRIGGIHHILSTVQSLTACEEELRAVLAIMHSYDDAYRQAAADRIEIGSTAILR